MNSGTITSGFGNIDNGTSTLTTGNSDINGTLNVQGETTLQTHLNMGDGDIIKFGASADLSIQHTGSFSSISDSGTGSLLIGGNNVSITNAAHNENMIIAVENGAVTLYHDNSAKLATTSGGVTVTGAMTGNVTGNVSGSSGSTTGNAATATKLATARTINGTNFDGTANITISAGKVLQCLSDVKTDTFSTNTTNQAGVEITGLTQAITPSATNHKVLVMVFFGAIGCSTSASRSCTFLLQRGGSVVAIGDAAGSRPRVTSRSWMTHNDTNHALGGHSIVFLDDPGTTSAVTYSVHMTGSHAGDTFFINRTGSDGDGGNNYQSRAMSTITCMEISD